MNSHSPIEDTSSTGRDLPVKLTPSHHVSVHLCVPADQHHHLPRRRRAPDQLPPSAPLPRTGDVMYLSPTSAWGVQMVIHEWQSPETLRIEVWLDHVSNAQAVRPSGFAITQ